MRFFLLTFSLVVVLVSGWHGDLFARYPKNFGEEVLPTVRNSQDLARFYGKKVRVIGRYEIYKQIFPKLSERMREKFDAQLEGVHYRGVFRIPKGAPQDWAGLLLEDGAFVFLLSSPGAQPPRSPGERKKFRQKEVEARGEIHRQIGEWGKRILMYGYADAYLTLEENSVKAKPITQEK